MNNDKSPSWNMYGDEDLEEPSPNPIKPNTDFFTRFLADRTTQNSQEKPQLFGEKREEEDEEDSKPSSSKKSKFGGFFSEIFPQIASTEDSQKIIQPIDQNKGDNVVKISDQEASKEDPNEQDQHELTIKHAADEIQAAQTEIVAASIPEEADNTSESVANDSAAEASNSTQGEEAPHSEAPPVQSQLEAVPSEIPPPFASTSLQENKGSQYINQPENSLRSDKNSTPTTRETVVERRPVGAVLAFLGADYLSRRRDRKLAAQIRENKKAAREDIKRVEDEQLSQKEAQRQLEAHQQHQAEKLAASQRRSIHTDKPPEPQVSYEPPVYSELATEQSISQSDSLGPSTPLEMVAEHAFEVQQTAQNEISTTSKQPSVKPEASKEHLIPTLPSKTNETSTFKAPEVLNTSQNPAHEALSTPEKVQTIMQNKYESLHLRQRQRQPIRPSYSESYMYSNRAERNLSQPEFNPVSQPTNLPSSSSNNSSSGTLTTYKKPIQYGVATAVVLLTASIVAYIVLG